MKVKVKGKLLSHVRLLVTPWTTAYQAPPSVDFRGKSTGVGCHGYYAGHKKDGMEPFVLRYKDLQNTQSSD